MDTEDDSNEQRLKNRRAVMEERRVNLALDATLTAAYLAARTLNELMRILDTNGGRFTAEERATIHTAHGHAHLAFNTLNGIVEDDGNQSNRKNESN